HSRPVWAAGVGRDVFRERMDETRAGEKPLQVAAMGVARDGRTLAAAGIGFEGPHDSQITLFAWDLTSKKHLARREEKGRSFEFPGFSADGGAVLLREGKDLVLKDLRTGKERLKLQPRPPSAESAALGA